jgi:hypothetical protein
MWSFKDEKNKLNGVPLFQRDVVNPKAVLGFGHDEKGIFAILNDGTVMYDLKWVTNNGDGFVNVKSVFKYVTATPVNE